MAPPPPPFVIVTAIDCGVLAPPMPVQVSVKVVETVRAELVSVPLVGSVPLNPDCGELDPVHEVAFSLLH